MKAATKIILAYIVSLYSKNSINGSAVEKSIDEDLKTQRRHRILVEKNVQKIAKETPELLADETNRILRRIGTTFLSIFTLWLYAFALVYNGFS